MDDLKYKLYEAALAEKDAALFEFREAESALARANHRFNKAVRELNHRLKEMLAEHPHI